MQEEWREVDGFPGYFVSDQGRVVGKYGRPLQPGSLPRGHQTVCLSGPEGRRMKQVHRLVAEAFLGPGPADRPMVLHGNGDPRDNRVSNLRWGSAQDNSDDAQRHGTWKHGSRDPRAKLTDEAVRDIRRRLAEGSPQEPLAREYGVSVPLISMIHTRRIWRHVDA